MKAVRMQATTDIKVLSDDYYDASALLLDAYHPHTKGGTGERFEWDLIPKDCTLPIVLAGGLDSTNAADAIKHVKPFALDVSSGVESSKGIKNNNKVSEFLTEVFQSDRHN
jgi:phosphoribosylanthranilate isomerase